VEQIHPASKSKIKSQRPNGTRVLRAIACGVQTVIQKIQAIPLKSAIKKIRLLENRGSSSWISEVFQRSAAIENKSKAPNMLSAEKTILVGAKKEKTNTLVMLITSSPREAIHMMRRDFSSPERIVSVKSAVTTGPGIRPAKKPKMKISNKEKNNMLLEH